MAKIITRDEWGSRGPKKPFTNIRKGWMRGIAVHHSGVRNGAKGVEAVRAFEKYHMETRGWNAIAYNWLIDEKGAIYEGRGAGVVSAATRPWNSVTESICYTGYGDDPIPAKTLKSLEWLIQDIQKRHTRTLWVKAHRELASTHCCGDVLFKWVEDYRNGTLDKKPAAVQTMTEEQVKTTTLVKLWSRGAHVKIMQRRLNHHGSRLTVDGIAGPLTIRALKKFQGFNGLVVDGLCGKNTWRKLYAD